MQRASVEPTVKKTDATSTSSTTTPNQKAFAPNFDRKYRKSPLQSNLKFYLVGLVVAVAAVVIVVSAMQGSSVYYYTIAEFEGKQAGLNAAEPIRLSGVVLPGSIQKSEVGNTVTFTAIDREDKTKSLKISYSGVIPDTFKDEAQVVVTGIYSQGAFKAKEMLAKCPSKYSSEA